MLIRWNEKGRWVQDFLLSSKGYESFHSDLAQVRCRNLVCLFNWGLMLLWLIGVGFDNTCTVSGKWNVFREYYKSDSSGALLIQSHSKNKPSFLYAPFWTLFLVKKRHHRNKNLGLWILKLSTISKNTYTHNIKTLIHTTSKHFSNFLLLKRKGTSNKFAPEIFSFLWYLSFVINKKEQARNLRQKYFHSYDTYTLS